VTPASGRERTALDDRSGGADAQLRPIRLFFFSTLFTPFIRVDKEILERRFVVRALVDEGVNAIPRILAGILRSDVSLAWFGSVYAFFLVFFSRLLRRPSIVIVAGADASKDREIHYGIWLNPWKARLVKYAFRKASKVIVVDPFLGEEAKRLAEYDGANIEYLPFGFDPSAWTPSGKKQPFVLTVAACENRSRLRKKGIDKLLEAAAAMAETKFVIVGVQNGLLAEGEVPQNATIIPFVDQQTLLQYYQRAKVYCQVSYTEGLPNALCEAMLCECIPVGTLRGGIPTAIGETGILIPYGDLSTMIDALKNALSMPDDAGKQARKHIVENFPLERRDRGLKGLVLDLFHHKNDRP
jgi:glycosyltransferase involved in cell wall biosynthesis